jgi:hypothetical protein
MLKIRASALPGFNNCMRREIASQYPEFLEESGFKIPVQNRTGIYAPVGVGIHASINYMLTQKILGSEDYTDPQQIGIEEYEKEFQKYDEIIFDTGTTNKENGSLQIQRITKVFYKEILPRMEFPENAKPEDHLEVKIEKQLENQGYKLTGRLDIITKNSIIEAKNGKKVNPYQAQLGGYGLLLGSDNFERMFLQNFPRTTLKKPYPGTTIVPYDKKFCMGEAWETIGRVINCIEDFKKKRQSRCFPANPNSYLCSAKYCKAFGTSFCGYHKGE